MSTHTRLLCALGALCLTAPVGAAAKSKPKPAPAESGGASYSGTRQLGSRLPVRMGMHGADVRDLQGLLRKVGMSVSLDGAFGQGTQAAQRAFERRAGRPVDGLLDADDLAELRQIAGGAPWPTPPAPPELPVGSRAKVAANGLAAAPADAPPVVKAIIAAGNKIASMPYHFGGGHGRWKDSGYDCSGSVSYALHGAGLLKVSRDSTGFEHFGSRGAGQWVTIYANGGHAWMMVAGLRFDTSGLSGAGSRWQTAKRSARGYVVRHPTGL
jgi:hypothetical protein